MAGNYWKWLELAGNGWKWLELAELAGNVRNRWKWLNIYKNDNDGAGESNGMALSQC